MTAVGVGFFHGSCSSLYKPSKQKKTRSNIGVKPTSDNKGGKITPDIIMKKLNMPTNVFLKTFSELITNLCSFGSQVQVQSCTQLKFKTIGIF